MSGVELRTARYSEEEMRKLSDMPEDWLDALKYHMATKQKVFEQVEMDTAALLREALIKLQAPVEIRQHPRYAENLIVRINAAINAVRKS